MDTGPFLNLDFVDDGYLVKNDSLNYELVAKS